MERLCVAKTGQSVDSLNCEDLHLDENDSKDLRRAVMSGFKDCRSDGGFFYGHQYQDMAMEEYKDDDLRFCDEAMQAMERGETVVYFCWY